MSDLIPILVCAAEHTSALDELETEARQMDMTVAVTHSVTVDDALECAEQAHRSGEAFVVSVVVQGQLEVHDTVRLMLGLLIIDPDIRVIVVARQMAEWARILKDIPHRIRVVVIPEPFNVHVALQLAHAMAMSWRISVGSRTPTLEFESVSSRDLLQTKRVESLQRHAGQLQAIGHLAAGIAHELGTPIQYAMDSSYFLNTLWADGMKIVLCYRAMLHDLVVEHPVLAARLREVEAGFDIDFYREEVPSALERLSEGLDRVTDILNAMRELAPRPEDEAQELSDLNRAIANTLTLARGTVRQHGKIVLDLSVLPPVRCRADKLSSVLLNLLINAVHALEDRYGNDAAEQGVVKVRTRVQDDQILLEVTDNGAGISREDGEKIFDPFFTTKEVGRGTGQGLAIARAVVESHGGRISFESRPGVGTTFFITVPVNGPVDLRVAS